MRTFVNNVVPSAVAMTVMLGILAGVMWLRVLPYIPS